VKTNVIQTYEWTKLNVGVNGLTIHHLTALLKLNELHGFNYLEATANGIRFRNYVGIIQVDQLTIEILPKVDSSESNYEWRDILLDMLRVCKKVQAYNKGEATVGKNKFHLLEIYMDMFLMELASLIQSGLVKSYIKKTSNSLALKGRLELTGHLSKNIVHKERFYTSHQVYDHEMLIHQILRFALQIVQEFSGSSYLAGKANRLSLLFPSIATKVITIDSFDKIHLSRKTKPYTKVLDIARVLIGNYSPQISKGRNKMLALLFNMDQLWEEFIFQSLKKSQTELGYEVYQEFRHLFLNESYYLKPDIIIKKDGHIYILDAKWKQPKDSKASQQDLRQIYTYCRFWNARQGFLLYPGSQLPSNEMIYAEGNNEISCRMLFIDKDVISVNSLANHLLGIIS